MKKVKLKFFENKTYNDLTFLKGQVYELVDSPDGFISRWLKRGCQIVESESSIADPRFPEMTIPSETIEEVKPAKRKRHVKA